MEISHNPILVDQTKGLKMPLVYRRHWINLLVPILVTVLMLTTVVILTVILSISGIVPVSEYLSYIILFVGLFVFLILSYFFSLWTFWYFDVWIIDKEKLIDSQLVTFFVHRRSELALEQVQDIKHSVSGTLTTIFRCGDIIIQSASKEGSFKLMFIHRPAEAVRHISLLVRDAKKSRMQEQKGVHPTTVSPPVTLYPISEVDLARYKIDPLVIQYISYDMAKKYSIIPMSKTNKGLLVAIANPSDAEMNEIKDQCELSIDFVMADKNSIIEAIQNYYKIGLNPD